MGSKPSRTLGICCFAGSLALGSLLQGSMSPAAAQYVLGRAGQKILIPPPPPPPQDVQDEAEQKPSEPPPTVLPKV